MGVRALTLNGLSDERSFSSEASGGIPFVIQVATAASDTSYRIWDKSCPRSCRIVDAWGVMTGAGAALDTVKITDGTNDISDTVDLSGLGDTDRFAIGELDDAYVDIAEGGSLRVVTVSDALVRLYIMVVWTD